LLAPFYALGLHGERLIWVAWAFGFVALALLSVETKRLADGLVDSKVAIAAGGLVLAFGGYTWFAASGMEVVPFALLLARSTRRAAEWIEKDVPGRYRELSLLAFLTPLMRPEGAVASLVIAAALLVRPHRGARAYALPALLGPLSPSVVSLAATGQAVASTAVAKWLPLNPYYRGGRLAHAVANNVVLFFETLLDGRLWTSVFLPAGGRAVATAALLAIPVIGFRRGRKARGIAVFAMAVAILLPTTYETFLVNRVRYIWPFAWAWFIGLAALSELAGEVVEGLLARAQVRAQGLSLLGAGAAVGLLASQLGASIEDLSTSSQAVTLQQVSISRWARSALGADSRIGVNDTGAMAYFSDRTTFDVVGLTTRGEARYWTAGPGSRFEHYERLPRERLPTHFVVYPEWFSVDVVLGAELASRSVSHTILGGYTMAAYRASYELLGSGTRPTDAEPKARSPLDALDVADVDDEETHDYALLDATRETDVVVAGSDRADGARLKRHRDTFSLRLTPGGTLVARWGSAGPSRLRVAVDGTVIAEPTLTSGQWQELRMEVPRTVTPALHVIQVDAVDAEFDSMHYWSYRAE
jgi:heme exporter protein D